MTEILFAASVSTQRPGDVFEKLADKMKAQHTCFSLSLNIVCV